MAQLPEPKPQLLRAVSKPESVSQSEINNARPVYIDGMSSGGGGGNSGLFYYEHVEQGVENFRLAILGGEQGTGGIVRFEAPGSRDLVEISPGLLGVLWDVPNNTPKPGTISMESLTSLTLEVNSMYPEPNTRLDVNCIMGVFSKSDVGLEGTDKVFVIQVVEVLDPAVTVEDLLGVQASLENPRL